MLLATSGESETLDISSDFSFGSGRPFGGATEIEDTKLELVTENTEPFGVAGFRDIPNGEPAGVLFCFDRQITEFEISVSRVLKGETVLGFSAGHPHRVTGDLVNVEGDAFSVTAEVGDTGKGTLYWNNVNANVFYFRIEKPWGALAIDAFHAIVRNEPTTTAPDRNSPCIAGLSERGRS